MFQAAFLQRSEVEFFSLICLSFTEWNLPFRALLRSHAPFFDNPSPYQQLVTTPEGAISIVSTPAAGAGSPPVASAPSPLSEAISQKDKVERAYLFIQGDHSGLASKLSKHDRGYDKPMRRETCINSP